MGVDFPRQLSVFLNSMASSSHSLLGMAYSPIGQNVIRLNLGESGWCELWRGPDTKLRRHVAIKALREASAPDADRTAPLKTLDHVSARQNSPFNSPTMDWAGKSENQFQARLQKTGRGLGRGDEACAGDGNAQAGCAIDAGKYRPLAGD